MKFHIDFYLLVQLLIAGPAMATKQEANSPNNDLDSQNSYYCTTKATEPWCIPSNYNRYEDPFTHSHLTSQPLPWHYWFGFFLHEVTEVNDLSQTLTMAMYFVVEWLEPRLKINANSTQWQTSQMSPGNEIRLPANNLLWYPDLEIYGLKSFGRKQIMVDMSYTQINMEKKIKFSAYSDVTISCVMSFDNFPLDSQICEFWIGSYSVGNDKVSCMSQFVNHQTGPLRHQQRSLQYDIEWEFMNYNKTLSYWTGRYDYCGFKVFLNRNRISYLVNVYVPACIFVMVSWVSFIIKPDIVPGRMMLLITLFLMLINILNEIKSTAPASKNLHAIDLFLVACIFHVFGALAEYAVILVILRYFNNVNKVALETAGEANSQKSPNRTLAMVLENTVDRRNKQPIKTTIDILDMHSMWVFPCIFATFNAFYWARYW